MIHEGEHKFKLSLTQAMPFTKDDIYHVIKTHPGISTREILGQLGYAASIGIDSQRRYGY